MLQKNRNISKFNSSVSVDCVILGFEHDSLHVLLVNRQVSKECDCEEDCYKLPGSMIYENENLSSAVGRVLEDITGTSNVSMKELKTFSDPERINGKDLVWLRNYYKTDTQRVITVAYYSLIKLNNSVKAHTLKKGAVWKKLDMVKRLCFDHKEIIISALDAVTIELRKSPLSASELLPKKFTISQLQSLYEAVMGLELDKRNFRRRVLNLGYIQATVEREKGVPHKPATYYTFNLKKIDKKKSEF